MSASDRFPLLPRSSAETPVRWFPSSLGTIVSSLGLLGCLEKALEE